MSWLRCLKDVNYQFNVVDGFVAFRGSYDSQFGIVEGCVFSVDERNGDQDETKCEQTGDCFHCLPWSKAPRYQTNGVINIVSSQPEFD